MKIKYLAILLFITSCLQNENANDKQNVLKTSKRTDITNFNKDIFVKKDTIENFIQNKLNLIKTDFCKQTDNILAFVNNKSPLNNIAKKSLECIRYTYKTTEHGIKYIVLKISYKNSSDAVQIFEKIKREAFVKRGVPGLTYTNDIVLLEGNKIYWFNSPCLMSYQNHKKLFFLLKNKFKISSQHYVFCKCGKVICNYD